MPTDGRSEQQAKRLKGEIIHDCKRDSSMQEYTIVEWRSVAHFVSSWRGVQAKKAFVCVMSHGSYNEDKSATEPLSALGLPSCQKEHFLVAFRIWLGPGSSSSMVALFHVPEQLPGAQQDDAAVHLRKEEVESLKGFGSYQQGKCMHCDHEHSNGGMMGCTCGLVGFCRCACWHPFRLASAWQRLSIALPPAAQQHLHNFAMCGRYGMLDIDVDMSALVARPTAQCSNMDVCNVQQ